MRKRVSAVALGWVMEEDQRIEMLEVGREFDIEVSLTQGSKIYGPGSLCHFYVKLTQGMDNVRPHECL